jgi:hypothetical protein
MQRIYGSATIRPQQKGIHGRERAWTYLVGAEADNDELEGEDRGGDSRTRKRDFLCARASSSPPPWTRRRFDPEGPGGGQVEVPSSLVASSLPRRGAKVAAACGDSLVAQKEECVNPSTDGWNGRCAAVARPYRGRGLSAGGCRCCWKWATT